MTLDLVKDLNAKIFGLELSWFGRSPGLELLSLVVALALLLCLGLASAVICLLSV